MKILKIISEIVIKLLQKMWHFHLDNEYRRQTLTSRCDVISDFADIKSTFSQICLDDLPISAVKMNLTKMFRNFQNGRHFEDQMNF